VFFRLRLRLSLQNTTALPTPILSLNLVQRLGGSHHHCQLLVVWALVKDSNPLEKCVLKRQD